MVFLYQLALSQVDDKTAPMRLKNFSVAARPLVLAKCKCAVLGMVSAIALLLPCGLAQAQSTYVRAFDSPEYHHDAQMLAYPDGGCLVASWIGTTGTLLLRTDPQGDTLWTGLLNNPRSMSALVRSSMGNVAIVGQNGFGPGWFVAGIDTMGIPEWGQSFYTDEFYPAAATRTADGGYVIVACDGVGYPGKDLLFVKIDPLGQHVWTNRVGTLTELYGTRIIPTNDNGFMLLGGHTTSLDPSFQPLLLKLDSLCTPEWMRAFDAPFSAPMKDIVQTSDGGYFATGLYAAQPDDKTLVIRTTAAGDTLWVRAVDSPTTNRGIVGVETVDGGFLIAGKHYTGINQSFEGYLIKLTTSGDLEWARSYDHGYETAIECIAPAPDGGYTLAGYFDGNALILKTDSAGNAPCAQGSPNLGMVPLSLEVDTIAPIGLPWSTTLGTTPVMRSNGINVIDPCSMDGLSEGNERTLMTVYPNPNTGTFFLQAPLKGQADRFDVLDALGRCVLTKTLLVHTIDPIEVGPLQPGAYVVQLCYADEIWTERVLVVAR